MKGDYDAFFMMNSLCILNLLLIYKINIPNIISTKQNGEWNTRTENNRDSKTQTPTPRYHGIKDKTEKQYPI
jgi:hypothetical protein